MEQGFQTKEEIIAKIQTLDGLHEVVAGARSAGLRKEDFYLLNGRFLLDRSGNFLKVSEELPKEITDNAPLVMTSQEMRELCELHGHEDAGMSYGRGLHPWLPPSHLLDPISGEGWTINNCHEAIPDGGEPNFDLAPFVGKTMREVRESVEKRTDGIYVFAAKPIQNDELIDLTPAERGRAKNQRGDRPNVDDNYVIQPGDRACIFAFVQYYHPDSYEKLMSMRRDAEAAAFERSFAGSLESQFGYCNVSVKRIPLSEGVRAEFGSQLKKVDFPEKDIESALDKVNWYQITSSEGKFEFGEWGECPLVYLKGSGITAIDISKKLGEPVPSKPMTEIEQLLVMAFQPDVFVAIRQCLADKR